MLHHRETVTTIFAVAYQERLRKAANDRLASAQRSAPSWLARVWPASPIATFWIRLHQLLTAPAQPARNAPLWQRHGLDNST